MPTIAQTSLADLEHEISNSRRVLERYPQGKDDFTPHPKSMPLGKLAAHVASIPWLGTMALQRSVLDFAEPLPAQPAPPTDAAGMVALLDEHAAAFTRALGAASDADMMETWTMKTGDKVHMSMPRVAVLRGLVISHMIHHRAQLTVYYRLLDVPVPGLYGPSADDLGLFA